MSLILEEVPWIISSCLVCLHLRCSAPPCRLYFQIMSQYGFITLYLLGQLVQPLDYALLCPLNIARFTYHFCTNVFPTFDYSSPDHLYSDIVFATHDLNNLYLSLPHIRPRRTVYSWTLDARLQEAKEEAERDSLLFQTNSNP